MKKLLGVTMTCLFFVGCASTPKPPLTPKPLPLSKCDSDGKCSPGWIKTDKGCHVWNSSPMPDETVTWTGQCQDGLAEGKGTLTWRGKGADSDKRTMEMKGGIANDYGFFGCD